MAAKYSRAAKVQAIAEDLIKREITFDHYRQFNLVCLFASELGDSWAKIERANPKVRLLAEVDLILVVAAEQWAYLSEIQQEALVFHELCHYTTNEDGKLLKVAHDVEEFSQVLRRYGPWEPARRQMFEQLKLWEEELDAREFPDPYPLESVTFTNMETGESAVLTAETRDKIDGILAGNRP